MATIFKRGEYYYLNYSDATGRQKEPLGKITKTKAKLLLQDHQYKSRHKSSNPNKQEVNFQTYATDYLNDFLLRCPSTYETSRFALQENFEPMLNSAKIPLKDLNLSQLTSDIVAAFIEIGFTEGLKGSTINRKLGVLTAFLNKAKADNYNVANFKIKKLPKRKSNPPKYYSLDWLDKIVAAETLYPHWWLFLANTGIRAGEFRNLKCDDIKDDGIHIISSPDNPTKSGEWRLIPMNPTIKEILSYFDRTGEYLIPRFNKDMPKTRFRRLCKKIEVPSGKWGIHCLRRTFASQLVMSGKPLRTVQILMGHDSITTTERYAFLSPDYLKGALENFGIGIKLNKHR